MELLLLVQILSVDDLEARVGSHLATLVEQQTVRERQPALLALVEISLRHVDVTL